MAPRLVPSRQAVKEAEERLRYPRAVQVTVALILCSACALGAAICFLTVDTTVAGWLAVAGGLFGLAGLGLAVRNRIDRRTGADDEPRTN